MTPEGDVAEIERVPPGVEHRDVEAKDAFAGNALRRWNERGEAIVYGGSLATVDARQKMPEGKSIARARFLQHNVESGFAARGIGRDRVKPREGRAEGVGSILKIRRAGPRLHW